jgi:predicted GNAT superfamily acetyltransferase
MIFAYPAARTGITALRPTEPARLYLRRVDKGTGRWKGLMTSAARIRQLRPSDHAAVIAVIDDWWGGRHMADVLPRLFFEHFADTSFAADREGILAGFLVGFLSQSRPGEAYIHFVGVHPEQRGRGLGRLLYEAFFQAARARGCTVVHAVTAPVNSGSVAFHRRMGFEVELGEAERDGVPVASGYDGPGQDRVRFVKHLPA